LFIVVVLLLCYSVQLTSCGFKTNFKKLVDVVKVLNNVTDCRLCYAPCKAGCKKVFEMPKSIDRFNGRIKKCKKVCKCEL
jgi:hypothetical protein